MSVPSQQFFQNIQDLTSAAAVSGAQLNQILTTGVPFNDKGVILITTDGGGGTPNVPDAVTYPIFATSLWLRISPLTSTVSLYYWNPNTGSIATYAKWQAIINAIPAGTITGSMIAPSTITGSNIVPLTLTDSLIASLSGSKLIAGTVPITALVALSITTAYIANNTITNAQVTLTDALALLDANIQSIAQAGGGLTATGALGKLKVGGTAYQILGVNSGATQLAWLTDFFTTLSQAGIGTALQVPQVNTGATALQWVTMPFSKLVSAVDPNNNGLPNIGTPTAIPHTLSGKPSYVRVVIVNITTQGGYTAGQELELGCFTGYDSTNRVPSVDIWTDATNIHIVINATAAATNFSVQNSNGTGYTATTQADWQFKMYAAL